MASYRLLRNNKETGPFSLDDLVKMGLKPYDLVWVDGRSAAWRYPSEVTELKAFAPAVEEQPFDRFFKKPSEQAIANEIAITSANKSLAREENHNGDLNGSFPVQKIEPVDQQPIKPQESTPEVSIPSSQFQTPLKKKVFVSMPESLGFTPYVDPYKNEKYDNGKYEPYLPKSSRPVQSPLTGEHKKYSPPANDSSYSPIDIHESDESRLETKYTQSLDDIKEMYINTLTQRKTKNRRKELVKKYVRPTVLPLLLVVVGVVIGYFISIRKNSLQASSVVAPQQGSSIDENKLAPKDENKSQPDEKQGSAPITDAKQQEQPDLKVTVQQKDLPQENNNAGSSKETSHKAIVSRNVKPVVTGKQQKLISPDENSSLKASNENVEIPKREVEVDPRTGERKSVVRDNAALVNEQNNFKASQEQSNGTKKTDHSFLPGDQKNLLELVNVKSNNYLRGTFGGIRDLELTVYNNSNYLLDEVEVEVQIMKPSEQPLRTDIITFKNIAANAAVTVKVPDSQRGIRVDYHITNIESKQWQKDTAGLRP